MGTTISKQMLTILPQLSSLPIQFCPSETDPTTISFQLAAV